MKDLLRRSRLRLLSFRRSFLLSPSTTAPAVDGKRDHDSDDRARGAAPDLGPPVHALRDVARHQVARGPAVKALRTSLTANLLASSMIACALATWIIADRFSLSRPSLIDDWWNITGSSEPARFRPAYTLWNYLQWHLFGAPESLIWPNVA